MAVYDYLPQQFDGQSLTASPFTRVHFMAPNSPVSPVRPVVAVGADVVGLGMQYVRFQPQPTVLTLHCILENDQVATLESFYKVFSEERKLVFLTANDGDGATWRIAGQVIGADRHAGSLIYFTVSLWVPSPLWEENSLNTHTDAITDEDNPHTFSPAPSNAGNRKCPPIHKIAPQAVKTKFYENFLYSFRGFAYNPGPRHYSGPLLLTDESGADSVIDHAVLTTTATTIAVINEVGGIDDNQKTIVYDGGSSLPVAGIGNIQAEQIAWSAGGGSASGTLTGITRGVGGTAPAAHAEDIVITKSEALDNGDDIRVWWDGVQIRRGLGGVNSTSLRVWAYNVDLPSALTVTLRTAATAGSPADAGDLDVNEDISGFPETGFVVFGDEVITYQSRDLPNRRFKTIERGGWGTTAAIHATTVTGYEGGALYTVSCGRGASDRLIEGNPPDEIAFRPAFQLKSSTNAKHMYGDESDDANTVFYDPDNPSRPAMFVPSTHVPTADGNLASSLRLETTKLKAGWKEYDADSGKLLIPRLTLEVPQGIEPVADAVTYDAQKRQNVRLRLLGADEQGNEKELGGQLSGTALVNDAGEINHGDTTIIYDAGTGGWLDPDTVYGRGYIDDGSNVAEIAWSGGGGASTGTLTGVVWLTGVAGTTWADDTPLNRRADIDLQDIAEASVAGQTAIVATRLTRLVLNAVRAATLGETHSSGNTLTLSSIDDYSYQKFVLDQTTEISAVHLRLKHGGTDVTTANCMIRDDSGANPKAGRVVVNYDDIPALTAGFVNYEVERPSRETAILPAGTYWLGVELPTPGGGTLVFDMVRPRTKHNLRYSLILGGSAKFGGEPADEDTTWFKIIHPGAGPVQAEADVLNDAASGEASFDKLILELDDSSADRAVPYVHRTGGFSKTLLYHENGTIKNDTTGQNIALDAWMGIVGPTLEIDCDQKSVIYTEGNHKLNLPAAITPTDLDAWMDYNPGTNDLVLDEDGMVDVDETSEHRGLKV